MKKLKATNKTTFQISEFIYDENQRMLFYRDNQGQDYRLANFEVRILKRYKLVDLNYSTDMLTLLLHGHKDIVIQIMLAELIRLMKIIEQQHPEYHLYLDSNRPYDLFKQYLMELYERTADKLPIELVYQNAGWNLTPNNIQYYYSGNDTNHCCSDFRLANDVCILHRDLINWELGLLNIGPDKVMIPLLLDSHKGYTFKLFEKAGYQEQYITALIGESGSKKTSLARVMFSLFGDALINFTSTDRAIELALMQRQDSTLILDDLPSGNDKFLTGKFEHILRQLGDSTGRRKSINSGSGLESVHTRCAVILTAETDIDALSKSSKLRTLALNIEKDTLNSSVLAMYQQEAEQAKLTGNFSMLERYMTFYIGYLQEYYHEIVDFLVKLKFDNYGQGLYFARQSTIFKILFGQAKILMDFWEKYFSMPQEFWGSLYGRIMKALEEVMQENEQRARASEPYILFLKAISDSITSDGIVAHDKNSCEINPRLGYFQTSNLILKAEQTYNYVCQYYYRQGKIFTESLPAILNKLYEMDLLEVYEQKEHKPKLLKQVTINGVAQRVICLKWQIAEMLLSQHI